MRITQRAVTLTSLQGLNRNLDDLGKLQQQLTSGRAISRPSDSPTGTNTAMQTRTEQASVEQQARNVTDAKAWLDQGGSTLMEMMDVVKRVRDLTLQGLNGSASGTSRQALATEVASLRDGLLDMANTKVMGRPLFGGVTAGQAAYDNSGAFVGDERGEVTRRVSDSELLRVDIGGREAFGADANNLFVVVQRIADALTTNPAALDGHLATLDTAFDRMQSAVADVGARGARLEQAEQVNADRQITLRKQLGAVEDIDLPKTIMDVQMKQMGYEAALAATAKSISPTLMDYLR
jgi:flagellin-like hook-associated protein FlgL